MPYYSYLCADCGPFDQARPIAAFAEPCPCPECGDAAPRTLSAAAILGGGQSSGTVSPATPARGHRTGCGCCTPAFKKGMKAEAISAGAPKRAAKPAPAASFLTRS